MNLIIEANEPFTIIRFENKSFRNSFGYEEAKELEKILKAKPAGILMYSGLPQVFCSGGNLKDYAKKTRQQCLQTNKKIRSVLAALSKANIPTALVLDGDCLGGGLEVLSAFDYVISSPNSLFAFWQRKIALSYGWGGGERLLQRLSPQELKHKSLEAKIFDAYEAKRIGLIDEISSSHLLLDVAFDWVMRQLQLPQESFPILKNFTAKTESKDFEKIWGNASHKKVLTNFVQRSKRT
jgi:enoyl-CoA hydratase/carnithine racemase